MSSIAKFQLSDYEFNHVVLKFSKEMSKGINVSFEPKGKFSQLDKSFELNILFSATNDDNETIIEAGCTATFSFENVDSKEDIPAFFYRNALAILFPYIRAFVSTVTLQANIPPMVLPTYNLSDLEEPLRENTITK